MLVYTSCIQDLDWTGLWGGVLMLVYTSCIQDLDWPGFWGGAYVSLHKLYTGPGLDWILGWCLC